MQSSFDVHQNINCLQFGVINANLCIVHKLHANYPQIALKSAQYSLYSTNTRLSSFRHSYITDEKRQNLRDIREVHFSSDERYSHTFFIGKSIEIGE